MFLVFLSRRGFNSRHLHPTRLSTSSRLTRGKPQKLKINFTPIPKQFRINEQIRAPKVAVINEEKRILEAMDTFSAIRLAREKGLDLVEVSPKAEPPVCRIMNYGKFLYKITKQEKAQRAKQKITELKGIRLSPRISRHDMETKANQAERFMKNGAKVRVDLLIRGREKAHIDMAHKKLNEFLEILNSRPDITGKIIIEQPPKRQPRGLTTIIAKRP